MLQFKHHAAAWEEDVLVITLTDRELHGEELADSLGDELLATLEDTDARKVVLDLQKVESISSSCIRPLLRVRTFLREKEGQAVLCDLCPLLLEIFTVTFLIGEEGGGPKPFVARADRGAAVAAFAALRS